MGFPCHLIITITPDWRLDASVLYNAAQVTSLFLDGQHITTLSALDSLTNLRWASFNDNNITNIEVLYSYEIRIVCL